LSHTFVYVSTIQHMARNLFGAQAGFPQPDDPDSDDDADKLDIPIYAFDLIVADECHRGYSAQELSIWRDTLQHFDAIRVGLTATPAAHTVALFGEPVFRTVSSKPFVRVTWSITRLYSLSQRLE